MAQITTVNFFTFEGWSQKFWALSQMQLVHAKMKGIEGLQFYKMMGSGDGNGFSIKPDFGTFALLTVWEHEHQSRNFFSHHPSFQNFRKHSSAIRTYHLRATKVHGLWDERQPFLINGIEKEEQPIGVLTRARIRPKLAFKFWKEVPPVSKSIEGAAGLLFSKGIGEWPLLYQATLSIWERKEDMINFAYHNPKHAEVIKKTRMLNWYSEELFGEFELIEENQET